MLSLCPQQKIVEKVLKTRAGGFVRAQFLVSEYQGRIHVKLLSTEPIFEQGVQDQAVVSDHTQPIALPSAVVQQTFEQVLEHGEVIISLYHDASFLTSQPTRAPSFVI